MRCFVFWLSLKDTTFFVFHHDVSISQQDHVGQLAYDSRWSTNRLVVQQLASFLNSIFKIICLVLFDRNLLAFRQICLDASLVLPLNVPQDSLQTIQISFNFVVFMYS